MTPSVNAVSNPLTAITVAAFQDLGYVVSFDAADPVTLVDPDLVYRSRSRGRSLSLAARRARSSAVKEARLKKKSSDGNAASGSSVQAH